MTGYLGRMAARAAGGGATVSPRVPSWFEVSSVSEEPATHARVQPPSTHPESHEAVPAAVRDRDVKPVPVRPAVRVTPDAMAPVAPAPAPGAVDGPAVPGTAAPSAPAPSPAAAPAVERLVPVARDVGRRDAVRVVAAVPVVPAAAQPPADGAPDRRGQQRPDQGQDARRDAPDVVVVSVGRVEVRAAPAPAPVAPAPAPRPTAPAPLSLQDYLRGQREAR